jgi:SOS response regulatory protein OraA/RecX
VGVPADATELALRALRHRSRSRSDVDRRLTRAGVSPDEREATLERLTEAGLLSDDRYAEERAQTLAQRGASDALIRRDLRRQGIERASVEEAVTKLEPEDERAVRVFERRGRGATALRYLARRGFAAETVERLAVLDPPDALE